MRDLFKVYSMIKYTSFDLNAKCVRMRRHVRKDLKTYAHKVSRKKLKEICENLLTNY